MTHSYFQIRVTIVLRLITVGLVVCTTQESSGNIVLSNFDGEFGALLDYGIEDGFGGRGAGEFQQVFHLSSRDSVLQQIALQDNNLIAAGAFSIMNLDNEFRLQLTANELNATGPGVEQSLMWAFVHFDLSESAAYQISGFSTYSETSGPGGMVTWAQLGQTYATNLVETDRHGVGGRTLFINGVNEGSYLSGVLVNPDDPGTGSTTGTIGPGRYELFFQMAVGSSSPTLAVREGYGELRFSLVPAAVPEATPLITWPLLAVMTISVVNWKLLALVFRRNVRLR